MKRSSNYFLVILIVFFIPVVVFAHPGRTDASGCHTCRTNCAKWGLSNGEYHCHNGNSSSSSSSSYNNSSSIYNNQPVVEDVKSSDTSIKSIKVDGELVELTKMEYKTNAKMVVIEIILNDSKATYEIDDDIIEELELGYNDIDIDVTAEDGSTEEYELHIYRMSSNTNIKVFVDNKEIKFDNNTYEIDVDSSVDSINVDYELEDENASAEIENVDELVEGENHIIINVTAEDGTKKSYNIVVNKNPSSDGSSVLGLITLGGAGYGIYRLIKSKKS